MRVCEGGIGARRFAQLAAAAGVTFARTMWVWLSVVRSFVRSFVSVQLSHRNSPGCHCIVHRLPLARCAPNCPLLAWHSSPRPCMGPCASDIDVKGRGSTLSWVLYPVPTQAKARIFEAKSPHTLSRFTVDSTYSLQAQASMPYRSAITSLSHRTRLLVRYAARKQGS